VIRRQVEEVRKERDALGEFNRELERSTTGNDSGAEENGKARRRIDGEAEVARLEAEIVELQTAVDEAVAALYKSERTRRELEEELRQLELEERELEADEAE
jgi:beclin 1